jgi:transcriptional regulator with XRE-family HTH domain
MSVTATMLGLSLIDNVDRLRNRDRRHDSLMGLSIDRLIALRQQHGWSQRELSRRCGFGESLIRKYETGVNDPSASHLSVMADLFGVSADYLLGRSDDPAGQIIRLELKPDEHQLLEAYRNERWAGIFRILQERLDDK